MVNPTGPYEVDFNLGNFESGPVTSSVDSSTYSISTLSIYGSVTNGLNLNSASEGSLNIASSLIDSSPSPVNISVSIAGTGSVANSGSGNLTLSGANTYSGGTSITNGGELVIGSSSTGVNSCVSVGPVGTGTLMLGSGVNLTTADSSCYTLGNTINLCGGGTVYLLYGTDNPMLTLRGTITGSAGLEVASTGIDSDFSDYLALTSRCSTFSGGVSVDEGWTTLAVGASSTGTGDNVTAGPLGTSTLMLSNGNNFTTTGSRCITIGNNITLCGNSEDWVYLLYSNNNPMLTLSGMISGNPALEVASTGIDSDYSDYLALTSRCSTFSGGVYVDEGWTTLAVGASSTGTGDNVTAGPLGTGMLMLSNGNNFTTVDSNCYTIGNDITLCGGGTVYLLSGTNTDTMLTLTGMISGASTLQVGGNEYNNYLALTSGCSTFTGGLRVESDTTVAVGASSTASEGIVSQGPLGKGTLMLSEGSNFTTTGGGCYTIDNAITLCGGGTVTLLGGSMGTMLTLNGAINGSSMIEVAAPGCSPTNTLTLTNPLSTFGGGILVDSGNTTLVVGASGMSMAGSITSSPLGTGTLALGSGTTLTTPNATPITVLNAIQLCGCVTFGGSSSGILSILGTISNYYGPGMLVIDGPTDLEGANTYTGGTTVNNDATVTVGSNTGLGSGAVTVNAGTLNFSSMSPTLNDLTLESASTINFAAGSTPTIVDMTSDSSGSGNVINLGSGPGSSQLTIQVDSDPNYYGTIAGTGRLVVTTGSNGTLDLFGANTYNGGTTVGDHTLLVASNNSAFGTGAVTVNSGGVLGVDNGITIANQITVNNGASIGGYGTIAPSSPDTIKIAGGSGITGGRGSFIGNGDVNHPVVGTLSFGLNASLVFGCAGGMQFSIMNAGGTAGTDYSQVDTVGTLNVSATSGDPFNIQLVGVASDGQTIRTANTFNSGQTYQWTLLAATGGITGFTGSNQFFVDSSSYFLNGTSGGIFSVSVSGNDLMLNFTPVPEPSTWAMMASGLCALAAAVRRRRR